jgi:hypothetical protein
MLTSGISSVSSNGAIGGGTFAKLEPALAKHEAIRKALTKKTFKKIVK